MPTAIWTGSISFGLVTVPVRLMSATQSQDVRFHQLEADTGARIRYRRVSEQTGEEVPNDQIVKGYELESGHYVVIEADELAALKPKASRQIEIEDFVDLVRDRPVYFEQPYYLIPDKDAAKAVPAARRGDGGLGQGRGRALRAALEGGASSRSVRSTACCASRRCATPTRCSRPTASRSTPRRSRASASSTMARQLVSTLAGEFDPEKYHDEYREEVLALIDQKAAGEEIVAPRRRRRSRPRCSTSWPRSRRASPAPVRSGPGATPTTRRRQPRRRARRPRRRPSGRRPRAAAKKSPAKKSATAKRTRKSA